MYNDITYSRVTRKEKTIRGVWTTPVLMRQSPHRFILCFHYCSSLSLSTIAYDYILGCLKPDVHTLIPSGCLSVFSFFFFFVINTCSKECTAWESLSSILYSTMSIIASVAFGKIGLYGFSYLIQFVLMDLVDLKFNRALCQWMCGEWRTMIKAPCSVICTPSAL